ncbi:MAG TPA: tetratricopeptide repeat protein [Candidatus Bathyarchaeia archaeon]|nr:tetratricopeptide repeat protein [Candidatus Bathyarchaeia archaeon]
MRFCSSFFGGRQWQERGFTARVARTLLAFSFAVSFLGLVNAQTRPTAESFDSLSQRANAARDADRLDEAVALYKKALALQPKWAEGWWSLGTIEYDRNNYRSAAAAFRQLLPLAPKNGTEYAMLGLCEFELGQDEAALKHFEQAKNLDISTNQQLRRVVMYHYGILLLRAGKFQAAQTVLGGLCLDSVPDGETIKDLGLAVFRLSPQTAPPQDSPGAAIVQRSGHAACLTVQKKYDEAHKEYADLVAEYPGYPNIHYVFGKFLAESGDTAEAVTEFQKELTNNPKDINSRLEIAATEYKVNSSAGIPYAEEAVTLNPHIPFAHYLLGLLYLDTDAYQKAIPHLEIAEKAFPKDPKVYFALGSAYARAGRKEDAARARAEFQKLSQAAPGDANAGY